MRKYIMGAVLAALISSCGGEPRSAETQGAQKAAPEDPYLWLEEVEGEKALDWVRSQNKRTLDEFEADPRFDGLYQDALAALTSDERLALGSIRNGQVYNFWQDDEHLRGIWRRAGIAGYRAGSPQWETVLDFDALAEAENENWIRGSIICLSPAYEHCMVEVSVGGKDAGVWREFNTRTKSFVEGGFYIPEAKSSVSWVDADTLIVGTDIGENALTESGYARTLRLWRRGEALEDARLFYEGEPEDMRVLSYVDQGEDGAEIFVMRSSSFFEREYFHAQGDALVKLPVPLNADIQGVLDGRAIFFLREDWLHNGEQYPQGAVVAYGLDDGAVETVMTATQSQSIESVGVGKSNIVVQYLDDVAGAAVRVTRNPESGAWTAAPIDMPENGVVSIVSTGGGTDDAMLSFESLTDPDSLYYVTADNKVEKIAETPAFFDATGVVVEQRFATSSDGTEIPYFVMGLDSVLKKGDAPTVQYGYGGFLVAQLPYYHNASARPQNGALAGPLWVMRGGVLVIANIRGGSEYGPRWHQSVLKENRQKSFDDFIAVAEHLVETGVTSPEKLGAIGRSNGGILMGAMLTQRPDLFAALDIGSPLFDMKRYNKLLAGASWVGEYGNPDIPEEWAYLSKYSPYQQLKAGEDYPKVLFYTSTKDDRVHPGHARKAAAKMAGLGYDFYYYENIEGGHGGAANQRQLAYRAALEYLYFSKMLMGEAE